MRRNSKSQEISVSAAIKSFLGYLEGTSKSDHTISNYRLDLQRFIEFLTLQEGVDLDHLFSNISEKNLKSYSDYLQSRGFKTNTRRRKLLTVHKFLGYLANRKKISNTLAVKFPTPYKIERVPETVPLEDLLKSIQALDPKTPVEERNQLLLWTLAETGCLVSEVGQIQFECLSTTTRAGKTQAQLQILGKAPRKVRISKKLYSQLKRMEKKRALSPLKDTPWIFMGYNRFGPLGGAISPRGVEIVVKNSATGLGFPELTPRAIRHSVVLYWLKAGLSPSEIQLNLGLKTLYAFRNFGPLLQTESAPKSSS